MNLKLLLALCLAFFGHWATAAETCQQAAGPDCYQGFDVPQAGGRLNYYASMPAGAAPTRALIAMHGHPRDANRTFDASLKAVRNAGVPDATLVVAPVFQVAAAESARCRAPGTPDPQDGDLLWTCASWLEGGASANGGHITSFAAMDALVAEVATRWPSLRGVTIAGFSAGGQMVQHYIAFARPPANGPALRYVVSDPGTWLYFDPVRPAQPSAAETCPGVNRWKYGTEDLPQNLGRSAAEARAAYAAADVQYLEGALDSADNPGAYYRILDKSCAAAAQGPFRLQRGQAFVDYERTVLMPGRPRMLTVVPGCAHDVACVFPSDTARAALLGNMP